MQSSLGLKDIEDLIDNQKQSTLEKEVQVK